MNNPESLSPEKCRKARFHWSFISVGLWASLAVMVILLIVGAWSYRQTNLLMLQTQERTGIAISNGLANAVEADLIVRNYAELEVKLAQAMVNEQVQSAFVADSQGKVLTQIVRNSQSGTWSVLFDENSTINPDQTPTLSRAGNSLNILEPVGSTIHIGWIGIQIAMTADDALLEGIHQQLLLILGLGAIVMLLIVTFSLRSTYSQVKTNQSVIEALNDSLQSAAFYDSLTRLPNRHLLRDRLQQALALGDRTHGQTAVCYLDLDGFKIINDEFGHDVGDQLLIEISHRLLAAVRHHDTVARIGGDEFVLVMADLHSSFDCETILERILHDVSQPVAIDGHIVQVSASIGIAMSHGIHDIATLISLADKAMYKAKTSGKNQWAYCDNVIRDQTSNKTIANNWH